MNQQTIKADKNFRMVPWMGYAIETERDEHGDWILAIRNAQDGEVEMSIGLTDFDVSVLFSIPKEEAGL